MICHRPDLLFVFIQMKNFGFDIFPYFIILAAICLADIAPVSANYDAACGSRNKKHRQTSALQICQHRKAEAGTDGHCPAVVDYKYGR